MSVLPENSSRRYLFALVILTIVFVSEYLEHRHLPPQISKWLERGGNDKTSTTIATHGTNPEAVDKTASSLSLSSASSTTNVTEDGAITTDSTTATTTTNTTNNSFEPETALATSTSFSSDILTLPPYSSLVSPKTKEIIGDVNFLLDFAIIAHSKCMTGSMRDWLSNRQDIAMPPREAHYLRLRGQADTMIRTLYDLAKEQIEATQTQQVVSGPNRTNNTATNSTITSTILPIQQQEEQPLQHLRLMRGYKSPGDLRSPRSMKNLVQYFPTTKLIIGIRHPILWLQSHYNYKHGRHKMMKDRNLTTEIEAGCDSCMKPIQVYKTLGNLRKTNFSKSEEKLLGHEVVREIRKNFRPSPHKVMRVSRMFCHYLCEYVLRCSDHS